MEIKKDKVVTISISLPKSQNEFIDRIVKDWNEKNPALKISKSFFIAHALSDYMESVMATDIPSQEKAN